VATAKLKNVVHGNARRFADDSVCAVQVHVEASEALAEYEKAGVVVLTCADVCVSSRRHLDFGGERERGKPRPFFQRQADQRDFQITRAGGRRSDARANRGVRDRLDDQFQSIEQAALDENRYRRFGSVGGGLVLEAGASFDRACLQQPCSLRF
jgi:hypothetical protein